MATPSIAVIGGGINGAGIGWELVRRGYRVTLFEKREFGWATSSKTTKMIHGGLRYLEQGHIGLVRESLEERAFLVQHLPSLVRPLRIVFPIFGGSTRSRWMIGAGLALYDRLGGRGALPSHRWMGADEVTKIAPLRRDALRGGYEFWDAQVDDRELVRTVIRSAVRDGLDAREHSPVERLRRNDAAWHVEMRDGTELKYDAVIAVAGPWMGQLLAASSISSGCALALVRGSHVVLDRLVSDTGLLLPSPGERRIFFVLPWKGATMIGTTEVVHEGSLDDVAPSSLEIEYLLERFNAFFATRATGSEIRSSFAGVRPLIGSRADLGALSREYHVESDAGLVKVFGGKMTTFLSLARHVGDRVDAMLGMHLRARPPQFAA
ncbi:MAG: glycerol-3-phosphate dehydrogenase/oxidase [Thermoanaerobaculia bacterium]|nr:glycerol-3-phosphate dehydrogenase/oxidase [Thermoanaerobaculia bacterium]